MFVLPFFKSKCARKGVYDVSSVSEYSEASDC